MKKIPDWIIQVTWFVAGICATGALWYFLSTKEYTMAVIAVIGAVVFSLIAISLHRSNDKLNSGNKNNDNEIVFTIKEEKIIITELVRSFAYDIVKVNAYTHVLGVYAEYKWLNLRYPKSKVNTQSLTVWKVGKPQKDKRSNKVYFDELDITLPDSRKKIIYFDITSFYIGAGSIIDPSSGAFEKIKEIYK
jgi:heme/copper-type cytochrome/quinol oxidase subunit 2